MILTKNLFADNFPERLAFAVCMDAPWMFLGPSHTTCDMRHALHLH